jgi:hypothetical protein
VWHCSWHMPVLEITQTACKCHELSRNCVEHATTWLGFLCEGCRGDKDMLPKRMLHGTYIKQTQRLVHGTKMMFHVPTLARLLFGMLYLQLNKVLVRRLGAARQRLQETLQNRTKGCKSSFQGDKLF